MARKTSIGTSKPYGYKMLKVGLSRTVNTGNYNSAKVEIELTSPVEGDLNDAYDAVKGWLEQKMSTELEKLKGPKGLALDPIQAPAPSKATPAPVSISQIPMSAPTPPELPLKAAPRQSSAGAQSKPAREPTIQYLKGQVWETQRARSIEAVVPHLLTPPLETVRRSTP